MSGSRCLMESERAQASFSRLEAVSAVLRAAARQCKSSGGRQLDVKVVKLMSRLRRVARQPTPNRSNLEIRDRVSRMSRGRRAGDTDSRNICAWHGYFKGCVLQRPSGEPRIARAQSAFTRPTVNELAAEPEKKPTRRGSRYCSGRLQSTRVGLSNALEVLERLFRLEHIWEHTGGARRRDVSVPVCQQKAVAAGQASWTHSMLG